MKDKGPKVVTSITVSGNWHRLNQLRGHLAGEGLLFKCGTRNGPGAHDFQPYGIIRPNQTWPNEEYSQCHDEESASYGSVRIGPYESRTTLSKESRDHPYGKLGIHFSSAWGSPLILVQKLSMLFPDLYFFVESVAQGSTATANGSPKLEVAMGRLHCGVEWGYGFEWIESRGLETESKIWQEWMSTPHVFWNNAAISSFETPICIGFLLAAAMAEENCEEPYELTESSILLEHALGSWNHGDESMEKECRRGAKDFFKFKREIPENLDEELAGRAENILPPKEQEKSTADMLQDILEEGGSDNANSSLVGILGNLADRARRKVGAGLNEESRQLLLRQAQEIQDARDAGGKCLGYDVGKILRKAFGDAV